MANIRDYIHWRGDLSFNKSSFNEIDNLVFAELSYIDYEGHITKDRYILKDVLNNVFEHNKKEDIVLGVIVPHEIIDMAYEVKDTKRYSNIEVTDYINYLSKPESCQFSAMCFHLPDNVIYVAFRGTDDSLVGWQENLEMLFLFPVPAQIKSAQYLNDIAKNYPDHKFIIGGHSKGGNLAVYASIYCDDEIKDRIIKVYNNDGQGFVKEKVDLHRFELIKSKIVRIIPQGSVVGLIFDSFQGSTRIVYSVANGLYQHDGLSWQVDVKKFVIAGILDRNAVEFDKALSKQIADLSPEDRKELAVNMYDLMLELQDNTLTEVQKKSIRLLSYYNRINRKNRKVFMLLAYNLLRFGQLKK